MYFPQSQMRLMYFVFIVTSTIKGLIQKLLDVKRNPVNFTT